MRALLRMLGVGLLGIGAAVLVACGDTNGLIEPGDAESMRTDLDQVAAAVRDGDCTGAARALQRAQNDLLDLPSDVDPGIRSKLAAGLANLADKVPVECAEAKTETQPTETETTPTVTTPTETTTTPPPTETTTTPPPTETTPPPAETTPAPDSGGQTAPSP